MGVKNTFIYLLGMLVNIMFSQACLANNVLIELIIVNELPATSISYALPNGSTYSGLYSLHGPQTMFLQKGNRVRIDFARNHCEFTIPNEDKVNKVVVFVKDDNNRHCEKWKEFEAGGATKF